MIKRGSGDIYFLYPTGLFRADRDAAFRPSMNGCLGYPLDDLKKKRVYAIPASSFFRAAN